MLLLLMLLLLLRLVGYTAVLWRRRQRCGYQIDIDVEVLMCRRRLMRGIISPTTAAGIVHRLLIMRRRRRRIRGGVRIHIHLIRRQQRRGGGISGRIQALRGRIIRGRSVQSSPGSSGLRLSKAPLSFDRPAVLLGVGGVVVGRGRVLGGVVVL